MNICPVGAVFVPAVATTKVVDGLAGKALGGKAGAGDDDLAVFIAISGICGLMARHVSVPEDFKSSEGHRVGGEPLR
jgi:hypothetical protein